MLLKGIQGDSLQQNVVRIIESYRPVVAASYDGVICHLLLGAPENFVADLQHHAVGGRWLELIVDETHRPCGSAPLATKPAVIVLEQRAVQILLS